MKSLWGHNNNFCACHSYSLLGVVNCSDTDLSFTVVNLGYSSFCVTLCVRWFVHTCPAVAAGPWFCLPFVKSWQTWWEDPNRFGTKTPTENFLLWNASFHESHVSMTFEGVRHQFWLGTPFGPWQWTCWPTGVGSGHAPLPCPLPTSSPLMFLCRHCLSMSPFHFHLFPGFCVQSLDSTDYPVYIVTLTQNGHQLIALILSGTWILRLFVLCCSTTFDSFFVVGVF